MEYRNLGTSDLKVSAIAFGAWAAGGWMWGGTDEHEAVEAIRTAYDAGVTSIDTAPIYGQGLSEEIVGKAIKDISRDGIQILTKYGLRWDLAKGSFYFSSKMNNGTPIDVYRYSGKKSVIQECEKSLRRLQTDYIDLYQIHWHDETTPIEETMEAVARLIDEGKVRYAGVCNYEVEWMKTADKVVPIISNQISYSMINRNDENGLVSYCSENGKGVLAYSPLARGLLTGKIMPEHKFPNGDHRAIHKNFSAENIRRTNDFLAKLKPLAESKQVSLAQLVLRWTIDQPGITCALAGARNSEQALQNARAAEVSISAEDHAFIKNQLAELHLV